MTDPPMLAVDGRSSYVVFVGVERIGRVSLFDLGPDEGFPWVADDRDGHRLANPTGVLGRWRTRVAAARAVHSAWLASQS